MNEDAYNPHRLKRYLSYMLGRKELSIIAGNICMFYAVVPLESQKTAFPRPLCLKIADLIQARVVLILNSL